MNIQNIEIVQLARDDIDSDTLENLREFIPLYGSSNQSNLDVDRVSSIVVPEASTLVVARDLDEE